MTCTADRRDQLQAARRDLLTFSTVFGAALLAPVRGEHDRWTLDVALGPDADGLGPELALVQHEHDLAALDVCPRCPGETRVVLALESPL
jgi:hypothetical protein